MRRRAWGIGWASVLVAALVFAVPAVSANAAEPHEPNGHGDRMISFPLPDHHGHGFAPNALNYASSGKAGGPLLLFLPATRSVPADYRSFLDTASSLGYHVLALDYFNRGRSVVKTCAGIPDCYAAMQRNRFDGTSPNEWSAIAPRDSILSRLRVALQYLRTSDAAGDWSRYATGDHVHWSRIVVAGHSQGGGQAAFIAHNHNVQGALMFSSPVQSDNGVPAAWMLQKGVTPASRMYGFVSTHDMYFRNVVGSWTALGMGQPVDASTLTSDTRAHTVVSPLDLGTPDQSHLRSVVDSTPRTSTGVPIFEPTWAWMLRKVLADS
jgi:pimeloyl-ACP methyl ester carboxylesterase